jgi:hypothetical protein
VGPRDGLEGYAADENIFLHLISNPGPCSPKPFTVMTKLSPPNCSLRKPLSEEIIKIVAALATFTLKKVSRNRDKVSKIRWI